MIHTSIFALLHSVPAFNYSNNSFMFFQCFGPSLLSGLVFHSSRLLKICRSMESQRLRSQWEKVRPKNTPKVPCRPVGPGIEETRWKPRTRMYSRSWTTSENLCNRKTNLFFHASCAHIVSAKAPDQQFTKRQLTHKDTHGKHRLKTVHISPVTSLQCGVESVECGV